MKTAIIDVSSELANFGVDEDGSSYYGEIYYVIIEFADGRRYRNKHAFPGCEVFSDDVGMSQFDDIRESALADVERLATKIKASSKEINLDFWFKLPARYGSDAYSEAQVMAWERNVA